VKIPISKPLKNSLKWFRTNRGFLIRALICWLFALFFLKFDENGNYDIRYRLRGPQKTTQQIVLVTLKASDFSKIYDLKTSSLINTNEMSDLNDSFYWERHVWQDLLSKILEQDPRSVGITLYIGDNIGETRLTTQEMIVMKDPRIFWSTNSSEPEKLSLPLATRVDRSNLGHVDSLRDDDGITRRLLMNPGNIPHLVERLVGFKKKNSKQDLPIINFKGHSLFKEVSLSEVLNKQLPKNFFKNKIVLIGSEKSLNSQLPTPMGLMSRHEFWGQVTENFLSNSFILKTPNWLYAIFLLGLTIIAILIITHYPQSVALFFFVFIGTAVAGV